MRILKVSGGLAAPTRQTCCRGYDPGEDTEREEDPEVPREAELEVAGATIRVRILKEHPDRLEIDPDARVAGATIRVRILKATDFWMAIARLESVAGATIRVRILKARRPQIENPWIDVSCRGYDPGEDTESS